MSSLLEFQRDFAASLFDQPRAPRVAQPAEPTPRRALFGVYRNNVFSNFREALHATFPVVEQLVGKEFFEHAARRFVRSQPSRSGDLQRYGEGYPEFLAAFPGVESLPYLPDVAQLEWLMHEAFHAPEHAPLSLLRLAEVAPDDCDDLVFVLHPACRLLASDYPVHQIWQANQPEGDGAVNLAAGCVRLLVRRAGYSVRLDPLGRGEFALLSLLASGQCFARACEHVFASDRDFDVAAFLRQHVLSGTLCDFRLQGSDRAVAKEA